MALVVRSRKEERDTLSESCESVPSPCELNGTERSFGEITIGMSHIHQSSSHFKQSNKAHKSRHLTKGLLKQKTKGKVADDQRLSLKESTKLASKIDRKSGAKSKRQQAQQAKRQANQEPPKIVGILSLSSTISSAKVFDAIINTTEKAGESRSPNDVTVFLNQTKQRVNLLIPPKPDDLVAILDILKVADVLVLVIETNQGVDAHGEKLISLIKAQGQPAILGALSGLESVPPKHRNQTKKDITKLFHMRFPDEPRLVPFELDTANNSPVPQDFAQVLRFIGAIPAQSHRWRERRPYIVADQLEFLPGGEGLVGTVLLSGYIRGAALDVNNLIHIPDWGDFQVKQIDAATDPYVRRRGKDSMETESNMDENGATRQTLAVADPKLQETLETENAPDDMANEQTWPTDEELKEAEDSFRKKVAGDPKKKKKVPRGTSSYQAAWIVESEGEEDEDGDEDDEMADESRGDTQKDEHDQGEEGKLGTEEEEWEELKEDEKEKSKAEKEDEDDAMEEDEATKEEEEQDELTFPDEVQTPYDVAARVRFQKYRGLKSFRSSPWDPKEMLPREYARIFQFQNFFKTKKRVLQHDKLSVEIGQYVTLHVLNVPKSCIGNITPPRRTYVLTDSIDPAKPIVAGGLLKYENKTYRARQIKGDLNVFSW
eukprot:TRINITY_DN2482_c0_g1_i6.p1 TRINITY_DN2482_c0_g1~~TRINITY_DN2482_c0_g1_i6.p1  ORF type:complete len:659 (+),score=185.51 TRINITY_DN2482_c0_g1_i6:1078-3054(+)